ncbi:alginate lyase [Saccharobesus litoralis]|uniref:Alginate lyase n=1 Tax=Saccharobesus litoralis TaxID=2172099 RepID=A0A2S0VMR8_9ALTE|nr:alginate lyase family protein [Saccharobesus litoralis]AWB65472.1 alginate lyase [Saccharobesus litoralis]
MKRHYLTGIACALTLSAALSACSSTTSSTTKVQSTVQPAKQNSTQILAQTKLATIPDYIYYNKQHIQTIQQQVASGHEPYLAAVKAITKQADKNLKSTIESVLDKPKAAPSGNKNDYLSIAPYWWPNPDTPDGMPWINKDGKVNPMTRGKHTDQKRSNQFLKALKTLTIAYTYTRNEQYLNRIQRYIDTWMVNPKTRMNPHLNYAQGWPGTNNGTPFGVIEWTSISNVVTAMQLLKETQAVDKEFITTVDHWLDEYLTWLLTSELGNLERTRKNNHGSWYDYQVVGLMMYLNKVEEATAYLSQTKQRIEEQFQVDGSQPHELKRTKSVNYTSMNLQALVQVAFLAEKLGVDLWNYQASQGQSLSKAVSYFYPYLRGEKAWQYKQIWRTIAQAYELKTYPMLHITRAYFGQSAVPDDIYQKVKPTLSPEYLLLYSTK